MTTNEPNLGDKVQSLSLNMTPPPPILKTPSKMSVRIDTYRGTNAFERRPLSCYEKIKMFLMVITGIVPVRMILFLILSILLYLFSIPVTCCNKNLHTKPLSCWRKSFQWIMYLLVRIILFIMGFYWISTKDINKFRKSNCRIIVANHHTLFDGFILWWLCKATAASKIELKAIPLGGRIADAFQTIWINRLVRHGRREAIQQILRHVADPKLPPLVIFPQGTCSEIGILTTFKKGGFLSGLPVQPVGIDWYWNMHADLSFLNSAAFEIFYAMCQVINFVTVQFLDVHEPTEKEKHDPIFYGNNVRTEIANRLGVICTAHSLSDWILLKHSRRKSSKFDTRNFIMEDVTDKLLLEPRTVTKLIDKYNALDANNDGYIDYLEFCTAFKRDPHTNGMKNLFRLFNTKSIWDKDEIADYLNYDVIKDKRIGFEDFLVGISVCFVDSMIEDGAQIMFDGVNVSNEQQIIKQYIVDAYQRSKDSNLHWNDDNKEVNENEIIYETYDQEMHDFCDVVFKTDDEKVDFETFYDRILLHDQQHAVHHFLQMIITFRLGIKLKESDFIDQDKITVKVNYGNVFRSQSFRK
eukprot:401839_1